MTIDTDTLRERIRERLTESSDDYRYCPNCEASLSTDDIAEGECSQCHSLIDDDDEELYDDDDY